jgi:SAM-dependent methyltransferase
VSVAPDGSPVEVYLRLPERGEGELVAAACPAPAALLELGCGVGRVTRQLARLGYSVTAVDESPEMLAHVRGATTVLARIEELDLGRRFPCVLLASHFINAADLAERTRVLEACARHVDAGGSVVIETYPADWHPTSGDVAGHEGLEIRYLRADWHGSSVSAEIEYRVGDRRWTQGPFSAAVLDEPAVTASLEAAGLTFDGWLDDRHTWLAARSSA